MKKLFFVIALTLMSGMIYAQNVNIPDTNFKNYLLNNPAINTNNDNEISVSEAAAFTGTIVHSGGHFQAGSGDSYTWISTDPFTDIIGIEAFVALTDLDINHNNVDSINISSNPALTYLDGSSNGLGIRYLKFRQQYGTDLFKLQIQ